MNSYEKARDESRGKGAWLMRSGSNTHKTTEQLKRIIEHFVNAGMTSITIEVTTPELEALRAVVRSAYDALESAEPYASRFGLDCAKKKVWDAMETLKPFLEPVTPGEEKS